MDGARRKKISRILAAAMELPAADRAEYVERACADDQDLLRDVRSLLAGDATAAAHAPGDPPSAGARASTWNAFIEQLRSRGPGYQRYVFEGQIAEGGMGAIHRVFDQDARRTLALKVMLGRGSHEAAQGTPPVDDRSLGRFLEEAQVTSQLDHPGIVPVHELGVDGDGQFYFTMKLVKGEDLRSIFERVLDPNDAEWTTTRALGVMLRVCEAMAYAHEKGVLHRDLKPGNVMVGKHGEAYVMDWGLATIRGRPDIHDLRIRAQDTGSLHSWRADAAVDTPDSPIVTMDGTVIGTPAYMPPEQARGDVESLSYPADVYAVGAMLYHLLSGRVPYTEPGERISKRTILAMVLRGPPRALQETAPNVPPELIAIVEKAMARDARERYPDMTGLAGDLRAFLEQRVVSAYRTGPLAELHSWIRRNKALAAAVGLLLIVLAAAVVIFAGMNARERVTNRDLARANREIQEQADTLGIQRTQAIAAKDSAERESARSAAMYDYLLKLLTSVRPGEDGRDVRVFDVLLTGALELEGRFGASPHLKVALLTALGDTLVALGIPDAAEDQLRAAVELCSASLSPEDLDAMRARNALASLLSSEDRWEEVAGALGPIASTESDGDERIDRERLRALSLSAASHIALGAVELGLAKMRRVVERCAAQFGESDHQTITAQHRLAVALCRIDPRWPQTEAAFDDLLGGLTRDFGPEHPDTLRARHDFAEDLADSGRWERADAILRPTLESLRRVLGHGHPTTLRSIGLAARIAAHDADHERAEALYREQRQGLLLLRSAPDSLRLAVQVNLARELIALNRHEEAEPMLCETMVLLRADASALRADALLLLVELLCDDERHIEARPIALELRELLPPDHPARAKAQSLLKDLDLPPEDSQ